MYIYIYIYYTHIYIYIYIYIYISGPETGKRLVGAVRGGAIPGDGPPRGVGNVVRLPRCRSPARNLSVAPKRVNENV